MNRMNRIRNALLIQSALGKHRARESASTGKEGLPHDKRPLILDILIIPKILIQTTREMGGHPSLPTTSSGAVKNRAYRGFKSALTKLAYRLITVERGKPVPRRVVCLKQDFQDEQDVQD